MRKKAAAFKDDYYVDAWARFVPKFECAIGQIKNKNIPVYDRIDYHCLGIAGRERARGGLPLHRGIQYPTGYWHLEKDTQKLIAMGGIHPFSVMLDGKFNRSGDAAMEMERLFGFSEGTITDAFVQGFMYQPGYRDTWEGQHWSYQGAFHVGRHLINKHVVPDMNQTPLPYKIPTILLTRGIIKQ